jgi:phage shock protein A
MAEGLAKRVGRIISGSINAVVDAVEGAAPEMVMEEAMREIDSAIDDVRSEMGKTIAAKYLANKRLSEKNSKHEDLSEKIEIAVAERRDDLAEAAISHQLDIEAQLPVLEQTITEHAEREKELEGFVNALQAKKREMKEELAAYRTSRANSAATLTADTATGASGNHVNKRVDNATAAFDRILERQTGLGTVKSDAQTAAKLAELESIARENRVKERLAAIKSATGN